MPLTRVRGIDLHYEVVGVGPSLVIAHGALGSIAHAEAFGVSAAALATSGFRVITYDARGHGRSGYTVKHADYRAAALAADLLGLIDALGLEQVSVYGSSMGASTALMLASSQPSRVGRLVLRSPSPFGSDMATARARLYRLASMYRWLGETVTKRLVAMLSPAAERPQLLALLSGQQRRAIVPAIRGFLSEPLDPDLLGRITAPCLILTHADDPLHPLRSGEILRDRLPFAKLLVAPPGTRWQDDQRRLTQLVSAWMKGELDEVRPYAIDAGSRFERIPLI